MRAATLPAPSDRFTPVVTAPSGRRGGAPFGPAKVSLVTGGTDGVGKAIARGLADAGFTVAIVGRDAAKGLAAAEALRRASGNAEVFFLQADLGVMAEVEALADQVLERWPQLHRIVLCAGIVRGRRTLTPEGVESNFAVNYLGRFALVRRLLSALAAGGTPAQAGRLVLIGGAAQGGRIHEGDPNLAKGFSTLRAVAQFCAANDAFALELARRIGQAPVAVTELKLGVVRTAIRREFPLWMKLVVPILIDPFLAQPAEEVARSALRLTLDDEFEGVSGALYRHIRAFRPLAPDKLAADPAAGRRLWALSDAMVDRALSRTPSPLRRSPT